MEGRDSRRDASAAHRRTVMTRVGASIQRDRGVRSREVAAQLAFLSL